MKPLLILAIAASLFIVGDANAGRSCSSICAQRVVVAHQVAPIVVAPVVDQYQYKYYVGQGLRDAALVEKSAARVLELLQSKLQSGATYPPQQVGSVNEGGAVQPATNAKAKLQAIYNQSCIRCHNPQDPKRMDLTDVSKLSELQVVATMREVYNGTMPKNGKPLPDTEVATFVEAVAGW